jgi:hypothetical protein
MVTTTSFAPRAFAFDERVAHEARARHAVRMADGDGAAIHVQALVGMPSLSRQ